MKQKKGIVLFGFTLIELLVVISIITVLAGLTLSMVDYARNKAARDRTQAEISALELALESYKIDNGDYPRSDTTDGIATTTETSKDYAISSKGGNLPATSASASIIIYTALSADTDRDRKLSSDEKSNGRIYFSFKQGMLYPMGGAGTVQALIDPFRNVYGYSTMYNSQLQSDTTGNITPQGYNPTFDLWSTCDPARTGTTGTAVWIKNW